MTPEKFIKPHQIGLINVVFHFRAKCQPSHIYPFFEAYSIHSRCGLLSLINWLHLLCYRHRCNLDNECLVRRLFVSEFNRLKHASFAWRTPRRGDTMIEGRDGVFMFAIIMPYLRHLGDGGDNMDAITVSPLRG